LHIKSQGDAHHANQTYNHHRFSRPLIVLLLFVAAFGVRLYHINRPALDFAPIRQYQNAHIIRGLYYQSNNSIPESSKRIAKLNMERMGFVLEPRIVENASIIGYRIMGAERLWIPRVLSSIFWIIGGFFLYLIAMKCLSPGISLFTTFIYLFLPYGILASRAIQPDPLMVMMMLLSIYSVFKYDENPSLKGLIFTALVTAISVLIKPYCIFMIFGAFISLAIHRQGLWKALFHRSTLIFAALIVLPAAVYYGYNLLFNVGFVGEHVQGSFLPQLLIFLPFWKGWLHMIGQVVGYIVFILAFLGLFVTQHGRLKALLTGLWVGYFFFGLSATYQMHTHSYYSMPFIPIAALSLGPAGTVATNHLRGSAIARSLKVASVIIFCVLIVVLGLGMRKPGIKNILVDHKDELKTIATFISIPPEFGSFLKDDFNKEERIAKEIGAYVKHSTNTVFLDADFGRVLAYYGGFAGLPWPTSISLYERRLRGVHVPDIKEDFTDKYIIILYQGKFIKYTPDFFIVTAFDDFEKQEDLKEFLNSNYPVLVSNENYLIFDMRKKSE